MNTPTHDASASNNLQARIPIKEWLAEIVPNVFETMIGKQAVACDGPARAAFASRVSGSVGIAGPTITGAIYLHFAEEFAREITCAMLGLSGTELNGDTEINDVIGEVCNMVGGSLKSALCDHHLPCAMSTPAIIRGTFEIETLPGTLVHHFAFQCGSNRVVVEVHLKPE